MQLSDEGILQYTLDINYTLSIVPAMESFYHHVTIVAAFKNVCKLTKLVRNFFNDGVHHLPLHHWHGVLFCCCFCRRHQFLQSLRLAALTMASALHWTWVPLPSCGRSTPARTH